MMDSDNLLLRTLDLELRLASEIYDDFPDWWTRVTADEYVVGVLMYVSKRREHGKDIG